MLNYDDCEMLLDALDALQSRSAMNDILSGIMKITLASSTEEAERERLLAIEEMENNENKEEQLRKRITLLKAKIIQIEDGLAVEDMKRFAEE